MKWTRQIFVLKKWSANSINGHYFVYASTPAFHLLLLLVNLHEEDEKKTTYSFHFIPIFPFHCARDSCWQCAFFACVCNVILFFFVTFGVCRVVVFVNWPFYNYMLCMLVHIQVYIVCDQIMKGTLKLLRCWLDIPSSLRRCFFSCFFPLQLLQSKRKQKKNKTKIH